MELKKRFFAAPVEPCKMVEHTPAPYFRCEFENNGLISSKIAISGLGFYRLFINGTEITKGLLSPYISNLDHIIYYDVYDLAPYLTNGANCVGVMLGNGMRNPIGAYVWSFQEGEFTGVPCFALEFFGKNEKGEEIAFTAADFKYAPSPTVFDDLRAGEWYDARLEIENWNIAGFDDSAWEKVIKVEAPKGEMRLCTSEPIVKTKELKAVKIRYGNIGVLPSPRDCYNFVPFTDEDKKSDGWIYDFGINAAGICKLKIKNAKPGQKIILQFGEILGEADPQNEGRYLRDETRGLDLSNWSFLPHRYNNRDVYICKGGEVEEWAPGFTYHGFRYCLVLGLEEGQATSDLLTYEVMNTDLKSNAHFECSDETANALWRATKVSNLANFYHFPTDCPHREKNGWTGDAALSAEQMILTLTVDKAFKEWLYNVYLAVEPDGKISSIVPSTHWGYCGPAWDSVLFYIPYYLWQYRGDTEVISESADAQVKYLNFLNNSLSQNNLIEFGLGDWCQVGRSADDPQTPNSFTSTIISIDICEKAMEMLGKIGRADDRVFAQELKNKLLKGARAAFIKEGKLIYNYQTALAMAIYYNILNDSEKPTAEEELIRIIEENNSSFACGILGLRVLFHVLSKMGRTDLAFYMITKKDYPSYGYWIENGATSLWEVFTPYEKGQSSLNHHFFGDIVSWFMQNLVGIKVDFKEKSEIRFEPRFIKALTYAKGDIKTPNGTVYAAWQKEGEVIKYTVKLPQNESGKIVLEKNFEFWDKTNSKTVKGETILEIREV